MPPSKKKEIRCKCGVCICYRVPFSYPVEYRWMSDAKDGMCGKCRKKRDRKWNSRQVRGNTRCSTVSKGRKR
jgi:hypothetical protein